MRFYTRKEPPSPPKDFVLRTLDKDYLTAIYALEQACVREVERSTGYLGAIQHNDHRASLLLEGGTIIGAFDKNDRLVGQQLGRFVDKHDFDVMGTDFHSLNDDLCAPPLYLMYNNFITRDAQNKNLHEAFLSTGIALSDSRGYQSQIFQVSPKNITVMRSGMRNGFIIAGCGIHRRLAAEQLVFFRSSDLLVDACSIAQKEEKHLQLVSLKDWQKLVDCLESDYAGIGFDSHEQTVHLLPLAVLRGYTQSYQQVA